MKIFQGWPFLLGTQTATPAVSSHDLPFGACVLGHPQCVPVNFFMRTTVTLALL